MILVTLRWRHILTLDENPECRACGYILWPNEQVYHVKGHGFQGSYFCKQCIDTKPIIIYQMRNTGKRKAHINISLPRGHQ